MSKTYSLRFGSGDPRTFTGLSPTLLIFTRLDTGATLAAPSLTEALSGSGIYAFTWGTTTPIAFLADAATTGPGSTGRYVTGQIDPADRADEYGTTLVAIGASILAFGTTTVALGTTSIAIGTSHIAQGVSIAAQNVTIIAQSVSIIAQGVTLYAFEQAIGSTLTGIGNTSIALGNTILSLVSIGDSLLVAIGSTASSAGDSVTDPGTLFGYLKRVAELVQGQETFIKGTGVFSMYDRTGATLFNQRTISNSASMVTRT